MFRIAICDDEIGICLQLEKILYTHKKASEFLVDTYHSGEELYNAYEHGILWDLIILDIELGGLDGVEIGNLFRGRAGEITPQILFISGKEGYALQLFSVRPLDFLVKPLNTEKVLNDIDIAMELSSQYPIYCEFSINKTLVRIPYHKILYFETSGKIVNVHTFNGIYQTYDRLPDITSNAPGSSFVRIHKSFLINWNYVFSYQKDKVVIKKKDGKEQELPVSRPYRNALKEFFLASLRRRDING